MIIGIDLGGTNLRIGAVDQDNRVWFGEKKSSVRLAKAENPMKEFIAVIDEYIRENGISSIGAISIRVPSSAANDKEKVICTTNIQNDRGEPIFVNRNIARDISHFFHIPVFVNSDTKNILLYDVMSNCLDEKSVNVGIYIVSAD